MVRNKKIIIAIGGGGFTHSSDEDLDEFVINQVNKSKINIGFLPTASNDNQEKIDLCLLYTSPSPRDATLSRMPSSA